MVTPMRLRTRGETGQNLIEFALLMPVVILFIGIIVVVGLALHTRSNLQQSVREGARLAAVGNPGWEDVAVRNAGGAITAANLRRCLPDGSTGQVGDQIAVEVTGYSYTLISSTGIVSAFGVGSLTVPMAPRATARLERSLPPGAVQACPTPTP